MFGDMPFDNDFQGQVVSGPGKSSYSPATNDFQARQTRDDKLNEGVNYAPITFNLAAGQAKNLLKENKNRRYLLIQNFSLAVPLAVYFQNINLVTGSAIGVQAIFIVAGGTYEPLTPPTNPISLQAGVAGAMSGVIIEG